MHCAIAFDLLRKGETSFLSRQRLSLIRKPLIKAILSTDMAKHAEAMTRLAALIDCLKYDSQSAPLPWYWPARPPANASNEQRQEWEKALQEEFVMELFLHAADIGNPTLPFEQWVRWNRRVQNEFHRQGDLEVAEFGRIVSPPAGFDRKSDVMAEHAFSAGFMKYLVLPCWESLHELTQIDSARSVTKDVDIGTALANLQKNLVEWETFVPVRDDEEGDVIEPATAASDHAHSD